MSGKSPSVSIVEQLITAWEALDAHAVAACFRNDGVWHNIPYAPLTGREAIRAAAAKFISGFTGCRFEILHSGEVAPGVVMNERVDIFRRADGEELRFAVAGVFEVQDGLIRIWRDYFDSAVMNQAS
jgi:limonene-1,2-epoxide hydrolase